MVGSPLGGGVQLDDHTWTHTPTHIHIQHTNSFLELFHNFFISKQCKQLHRTKQEVQKHKGGILHHLV